MANQPVETIYSVVSGTMAQKLMALTTIKVLPGEELAPGFQVITGLIFLYKKGVKINDSY
jgi:hypothetical protein